MLAGVDDDSSGADSMKVTSLQILNIGLIEDETIQFDKPLLLFYGQVKQGKTTILNAVRWVFGGSFPADIIRPGADMGVISLNFENGQLVRTFYRADNGEIKARPLRLTLDGISVARPVDKLKGMLNPFLLDQNFLTGKTELERKKYFAEMFNTSTAELDAEAAKANTEAAELRFKVKGYGDIDLTKHAHVSVSDLREALQAVQDSNKRARDDHAFRCAGVQAANKTWSDSQTSVNEWRVEVENLREKLAEAEKEVQAGVAWLTANPVLTTPIEPIMAPTAEIEQKISDVGAQNVRCGRRENSMKGKVLIPAGWRRLQPGEHLREGAHWTTPSFIGIVHSIVKAHTGVAEGYVVVHNGSTGKYGPNTVFLFPDLNSLKDRYEQVELRPVADAL